VFGAELTFAKNAQPGLPQNGVLMFGVQRHMIGSVKFQGAFW
jgi:hypothetical protein